VNKGPQGTLSQ